MKRTPYYDLAENIANSCLISMRSFYVCLMLDIVDAYKFINLYMEDAYKSKIHNSYSAAWMNDVDSSILDDNNHRIIALLLLHEMEVNP